jgi:hypothetical protein
MAQVVYPDILPPTIATDGWDPRISQRRRAGEVQPRQFNEDQREWKPLESLPGEFRGPIPAEQEYRQAAPKPADYYKDDNPFTRTEKTESLIAKLMEQDASLTRDQARRKAIQLMRGVKNPLSPDNLQTFATADIKRKQSMATYGGYDQYAQSYMASHPDAVRPPLLYDDQDGAFIVYKETNNKDGYQPGEDQVKYVNGYYVKATTFEKGEQKFLEAKQLARRTGAEFKNPRTNSTWKKQEWLVANGWVEPRTNKKGELIPPSPWNVVVKNVFAPAWKEAIPKESPQRKVLKNSLLRMAGKFLARIQEANGILAKVFVKYGVREDLRGKPEYIAKAKTSNLYKGLVEDLLKQYSRPDAKAQILQWIRAYVADIQMDYKPRDYNPENWRRAPPAAPAPAAPPRRAPARGSAPPPVPVEDEFVDEPDGTT